MTLNKKSKIKLLYLIFTLLNIFYLSTEYLLQKVYIGSANFEKNIPITENISSFQSILLILTFLAGYIFTYNAHKYMPLNKFLKITILNILLNIILVYLASIILDIYFLSTIYLVNTYISAILLSLFIEYVLKRKHKNHS